MLSALTSLSNIIMLSERGWDKEVGPSVYNDPIESNIDIVLLLLLKAILFNLAPDNKDALSANIIIIIAGWDKTVVPNVYNVLWRRMDTSTRDDACMMILHCQSHMFSVTVTQPLGKAEGRK